NFTEPGGRAASFFHAWGSYGATIDGQPFLSCWLKAEATAPFQSFCLTAVAALNGRLVLPDAATAAFGRADYAYHLPAIAYAGFLKAKAARIGVALHQAVAVEMMRGERGIEAVVADGDRRFAGDLFVDASGADALLAGKNVSWESWRPSFCVDRLLVACAP